MTLSSSALFAIAMIIFFLHIQLVQLYSTVYVVLHSYTYTLHGQPLWLNLQSCLLPYVLNNYGYVKHVLGDTKSGLEFILESLQILPSNSYAYKYLAEIYQSQGDVEKACESASTGIKLGFTNSYGNELIDFQKKNCR